MAPHRNPGISTTHKMELGQVGNPGQWHRTRICELRLLLVFLAYLLEAYISGGI